MCFIDRNLTEKLTRKLIFLKLHIKYFIHFVFLYGSMDKIVPPFSHQNQVDEYICT